MSKQVWDRTTKNRLRRDIIVVLAAFCIMMRFVPELAHCCIVFDDVWYGVFAILMVMAFGGVATWFALKWCGPEEEKDPNEPRIDPYWLE